MRREAIDVGHVLGLLGHGVRPREQHRRKWGLGQAPKMHLRDAETVAGDTDVTHESFVTGGKESGDRPAVTERCLPVVLLDEAVELDQINGVDPHAFERALEFGASIAGGAAPGLRGQEHVVAVALQEVVKPDLAVAVHRCGVDVIDAGFGDQFECRVGASLAHSPERRCAEDHARTRMAGAPERQGREVGHDAPRRVRMA